MYRLFIDEVGHENLKASNTPQECHLCLMGVILNGRGHLDLRQRMESLKLECFGDPNVVLHRRELIDKAPPFQTLNDPEIRAKFDQGVLTIIRDANYTALAIQIDKQAHIRKYSVWQFQPYHYCLTVMIERYVLWLKEQGPNARGDVTAEWRGKSQNMKLERSYSRLYRNGTKNVSAADMQTYLSTSQMKIEKKEGNVAGLQLADLVANPISRFLICRKTGEKMKAAFGREVIKILYQSKLRRSTKGRVNGYGLKTLP